jgi:hypothetical protein
VIFIEQNQGNIYEFFTKKMETIIWENEELRNAIELTNSKAKEIELPLRRELKFKIYEKFTGIKQHCYPTWEHLNNSLSVRHDFAWLWFEEMLKGKEVLFFFENDRDKAMFCFEDAGQLTEVLENCYGFVFYISNWNADFLLAYNDHDYLIACGEAKEWLRNYHTVKELGLEIYERDALEAN